MRLKYAYEDGGGTSAHQRASGATPFRPGDLLTVSAQLRILPYKTGDLAVKLPEFH
jgi:hypothetical protein